MPAKIPLDTSRFYAFLERLQCSSNVAVLDGDDTAITNHALSTLALTK